MPEHTGHLQRNQAEFPHNRDPMPLSRNSDVNRYNALYNIQPAPKHPLTGNDRVKDEKMPAMFDNPHHGTSTTVEYLDRTESNREGGQLSQLAAIMKKEGPDALGQLRPNPGWLPLDHDQRRGHEAPARLNSETRKPSNKPMKPSDKLKKDKVKKVEITRKKMQKAGYTPRAGNMKLRHRKQMDDPKKRVPRKQKKLKVSGANNLRPHYVAPPGHVWRPSDGSTSPSHAGVPAQPEPRRPPRPYDYNHYMKNIEDQRRKEESSQLQSQPLPVRKGMEQFSLNESKDPAVAAFNQRFPPGRGDGSGQAHEAPASLPSAPIRNSGSHDSNTNVRASSGTHGHQVMGQGHSDLHVHASESVEQASSAAATDSNNGHGPSGQQPQQPRRSPRFASSQSPQHTPDSNAASHASSSHPITGPSSSTPIPNAEAGPSKARKPNPAPKKP
ncbi:hypothetical protein H0H93_004770 [Arthromyces matolae]|nr:hypothetical protein H0H93_004770 [Arthromyces matolae]